MSKASCATTSGDLVPSALKTHLTIMFFVKASQCQTQKTIQTPFEFRLGELFSSITSFQGVLSWPCECCPSRCLGPSVTPSRDSKPLWRDDFPHPCCSVWKRPRVVWCDKFICQLVGYRCIRDEWTECRKIKVATTKIREMAANWRGSKVCEKLMERAKKKRSTVTIRLMMHSF